VAPVEFDREQDIGGLGAAVGDELRIRGVLEVRVGKIDIGEAVSRAPPWGLPP
jgi:hypothetical protein